MDTEKIREDFPALQQEIRGKPILYFDNSCVTMKPNQVMEAMDEYYEKFPACAGRSMHKLGNMVTEKYEESRKEVAKFIGAKKSGSVIFTRNTTEGINLVAHSLGLGQGDAVLTTDREHNSNLLPWQVLEGIEHRIIKSQENLEFDLEGFERALEGVKLVSMVHTSNLDGYTLPAKEIIKIAHEHNALVLLDGAQSVPHSRIDVKKLDVDFLAFSGHKMLGPSGTGALYGKYHLLEELKPFMLGGDTVENSTYDSHVLLKPPGKFEAGLQNYAGALGLAAAARYLRSIGMENIERHEQEMNTIVTEGLSGLGAEIIGPEEPGMRGGIISFNMKGIDPHEICLLLDENANIMIRSGQHCVHSWFNAHGLGGSARASFYIYNTKEEADIFIDEMEKLKRLIK